MRIMYVYFSYYKYEHNVCSLWLQFINNVYIPIISICYIFPSTKHWTALDLVCWSYIVIIIIQTQRNIPLHRAYMKYPELSLRR